MKRYSLLILCFLTALAASTQSDSLARFTRQQQNYNMEKFDLEKYQENVKPSSNIYTYETDSQIIHLKKMLNERYIKIEENKRKQFMTTTYYWIETLTPQQIVYEVSDCTVGLMKFFDYEGNVTSQIDEDAPFAIDVYQVADFVMRDEGIDILERKIKDRTQSRVMRVSSVKNPYYEVRCYDKDKNFFFYQIDATTGEVMIKAKNRENIVRSSYANGVARPDQQEESKKKKKGFLGW